MEERAHQPEPEFRPIESAACDPPAALEDLGVEQDANVIEPGPRGKALANDLILKELCSYLYTEDLMECRLVNKVWTQLATKAIRRRSNCPMLQFGRNRMDALIEYMDTGNDLEWKKFAVDSAILKGCTRERQSMLPNFFEKVAPVVTHLKITISADSPNLFPETKPSDNTQYPNLKYLEVSSFKEAGEDFQGNEFLIDILGHAPKLNSISIQTDTAGTLDDVIRTVPWNQISNLELKGNMNPANFQTILDLGGKNLQLKSLKLELQGNWLDDIRFENGYMHCPMINNLLKSQCCTLEILKLHFQHVPKWLRIALPPFPKLKALEISEDAWYASSQSLCGFKNAFGVNSFSVLESFHISKFKWINFSIFLHTFVGQLPVMDNVRELKFDLDLGSGDAELSEEQAQALIRKAGTMFPKITKLGLPANQLYSKAIDTENVWDNLEELTLFCDHKSSPDFALLEYPKNKQALVPLETEERKGNIFRLIQKIKVLKLVSGFNSRVRNPCCLSDITCRSVLMKLGNLKRLNLLALKEHHVSETVMHEMRENLVVLCKRNGLLA